jgi:hypothetical protein
MSNIFQHTGDTYFQIPKQIVKDGLLKTLSEPAKDLLWYLLYEAQERTSNVLLLATSKVSDRTGISRFKPFRDARRQLAFHGLVSSEEVKSGLWRYEIATKVSTRGLDLDALTRDELEPFFESHLGNDTWSGDNGLRFPCPFHINKKREHPLCVKLKREDDAPGIGVWHCFQCERAGKLIELEYLMAKYNRNTIDLQGAHKRVTRFFADLRDKRDAERKRVEALALI